MTTKTWARLDGRVVAELLALAPVVVEVDEAGTSRFDHAVPGTHIPAIWTDDVSDVRGIAVGWVKARDGSFAPPAADLPVLRATRIEELKRACALAITSGFTSAALGAPRR